MAYKFNPHALRLIIGLGNPEDQYTNTYHNIGHRVIFACVEKEATSFKKSSKNSSFAYLEKNGRFFSITKTFMNRSGEAVKAALRNFQILPQSMLVIHDDADIPLGEYKIQFGRGSAGHNGIRSIIDALHTNEFWRLRIGIRKNIEAEPKTTRKRAKEIVLQSISKKDGMQLNAVIEEIKTMLLESKN